MHSTGSPIQFSYMKVNVPIPVTVPSKSKACGLSLAGNGGTIPAWGIDVWLVWVLCCIGQRSLGLAEHSSRGDLPSEVCVLDCDGEAWIMWKPWPTRGCCAMGEQILPSQKRRWGAMNYFSLEKVSTNEKVWRALFCIEEGDRKFLRNVCRPAVPLFQATVGQVSEECHHDTDCHKDTKFHVPS